MAEVTVEKRGWAKVFFLVWTGQVFSLFGSGLVQFALVWWLTRTTGSAIVLATATFIALIPEVLLGPFAGALVDRWNRRLVMILADGGIALATVALIVLVWLGRMQVWHVYMILFLRSLGGSFHQPAMTASTSLMVPKKHLARVAGANQTLRGILGIACPPLGALLMDLMPLQFVLAIDVITAVIAISPLLFVKVPQPEKVPAPLTGPGQLFKEIGEGLKLLASWKGALALLFFAMMINFVLAPSGTLMALLVKDHFNGDAFQYGFLESALGVGIIVGGLLLSVWGGFKRRMLTSLIGIIGIGAGVFLVGLAPRDLFWLALAGNILAGFMSPIANGPIQALMQTHVPPEMQGRVFTMTGSLCTAMMPLSMIVAAPVANALGVGAWFLIGGSITILMGVVGLATPVIFRLEDHAPSRSLPVGAEP
jgi:DHA3 family macrolide efflux protein-like MFS transporter